MRFGSADAPRDCAKRAGFHLHREMSMSNTDRPKKSTDLNDLPPDNAEAEGVKGGYAPPPKKPEPVCNTGLMSTCHVNDSQIDTFCTSCK